MGISVGVIIIVAILWNTPLMFGIVYVRAAEMTQKITEKSIYADYDEDGRKA